MVSAARRNSQSLSNFNLREFLDQHYRSMFTAEHIANEQRAEAENEQEEIHQLRQDELDDRRQQALDEGIPFVDHRSQPHDCGGIMLIFRYRYSMMGTGSSVLEKRNVYTRT